MHGVDLQSNRLKGLQQDYGKGFDTNYTESKLIR